MLMAIFMRGSGSMTKLMDMELISMQMGLLMLENGTKISNTDTASKNGLMVPSMRASIKMARNMEMDSLLLLTPVHTLDNF